MIPDNRRRRQDPFGSFFGNSFFGESGKRRRISVSTSEKKLVVNELPTKGRPDNFQGLVGDYILRQRLEKSSSNNSYSLSVEILGDGSLAVLGDLELNSNEISSYQESRDSLGQGSLFKLTIIPKVNGEIYLPEKEISFYSPSESRYKKLVYGGQKIFSQGVEENTQQTNLAPVREQKIAKTQDQTRTKKTSGRDIFPAKEGGIKTSFTSLINTWKKEIIFLLIFYHSRSIYKNKESNKTS